MSDARGGRDQTTQTAEIPDKHVPAVEYTDLPEALPMKKVIGPSVLLLAGAIGSGEYVLWPYITSQVGLALVWLVVIGVGTQYFLNMEIERYTLATGETAVTGFTRLWKPWGLLFIAMTVIPWMWPGWATGGTTTLSFALGFSEDLIPYITIGVLALIGAVLTASPVVYRTVEKIQFFMVALIVLFILYAIVALLGSDGYTALAKGFVEVDKIPDAIEAIPIATLLGAIAFAGAGGAMNLVQSNWVRDKGLGMGAEAAQGRLAVHRGRGRRTDHGLLLPPRRAEHAALERVVEASPTASSSATFFVIGGVTLLVFMTLTFVTIGTGGDAEQFDFIKLQGEALEADYGSWLGTAFWLIGSVVLFSTNLTVLDMVGRLTADVLKTGVLRENERWSESKLYFITVWAMILFGSIILLSGVTQPIVLLVIASCLNGVVMFVYSMLLLKLNRGVLPREIGLRGGRLGGDLLGRALLRRLLGGAGLRPGGSAVLTWTVPRHRRRRTASRSACSGSTPDVVGVGDEGEQAVADVGRVGAARRGLPGRAAAGRAPCRRTAAPGRPGGSPSVTESRRFSCALIDSQTSLMASASPPGARSSPAGAKTCGLRRCIFSMMSPATSSIVKSPDSSAITAWK